MRLRFTIRDLLWLAVVVALSVGWWIDRAKYSDAAIKIDHLQKALEVAKADKNVLSHSYDLLRSQSGSQK